jgi:RsiW-degrading membrane proteinase PrsW (M82 family)
MADVTGMTALRSGPAWTAAFRRWSWLPVLAIGTVLYELVRETLLFTGNPLFVPTLILLGAAVVPVAFVAFISGLRLSFGLGAWTVGVTALLGGVVGVLVAGLLEFQTLRDAGYLPFVAVGLIEELAKLLVPAAVFLLVRRNRRPADGLLLGVAVGAGFAVLETMGYGLVALVRSGGDLTVVNDLLVDRALLSPAAHMAWTGLAAASLWWSVTGESRGRAILRVVVVYLFVAGLHAGWDSTSGRWAHAALALVSFALLVWIAHRLAAAERPRQGELGWIPAIDGPPGQSAFTGQATTPVFPLAAARSGWQLPSRTHHDRTT